jgi:uncharacterized protein YjlB
MSLLVKRSAFENPVLTKFFAGDGLVPNSKFPAVQYSQAIDFSGMTAEEAMRELKELADENDWYADWVGSVYRRTHYHSTAHECLVVFKGRAQLRVGGTRFGELLILTEGDALFIPAGMGHQRVTSSEDFTVFGLYPLGQKWDLKWNWEKEYAPSRRRLPKVFLPEKDPIFGNESPLLKYWKK